MDIETGLYYCNARYYDPKIYQWIQPVNSFSLNPSNIDGLKLYAYAVNSPIETIYNINAFNIPNIKYKLSWPDLSFLSTGFDFLENAFSTFVIAIHSYRKIEKIDNIPGLEKISNILMWLGIGLI